ncbi:MAG: Gfo/Idh/MocA family oxidoreductase [Candidatus Omnitrophica bacterium]|nr:Gfo/Idh/MocA family oxidoreductase [Candidatus Omnitrophota bacterium]MCM8828491.1 Gfo/Idh/MocA family oxidoreductase [Candidatus Omnitrophota bacterium]
MEEIRIGFIGCGGHSYAHLKNLKGMKGVKIAAVFDPRKENVEKFVKEAGGNIDVYESDVDLVKKGNLDGVVINSPHTFHYPQIKLALENDLNVLVEKPAVVNYQEAQKVKKLLKKTTRAFVVGYQRHYMASFLGAKKILDQKKLGKLVFVSGYLAQDWINIVRNTGRIWRFEPEFSGGGQLTDSGSHFVAMLFYITELTPAKVASFVDYHGMKVDINTAFIVNFKEKVIGSFGILGIDPSFREALLIWGEKGVLKISAVSENSYVHYYGEKEQRPIPEVKSKVLSPAKDLVECIKRKKQPQTPFEVIEKVALLSDKIYQSFREGKIVVV